MDESERRRQRIFREVKEAEREALETMERGALPEGMKDPKGFFASRYLPQVKTR